MNRHHSEWSDAHWCKHVTELIEDIDSIVERLNRPTGLYSQTFNTQLLLEKIAMLRTWHPRYNHETEEIELSDD